MKISEATLSPEILEWEESRPCNNFVLTASGEEIVVGELNPASKIKIEDIALSLSRQARFLGHTRRFYSVALHSYNLLTAAQQLYPTQRTNFYLHCLMHDAAEAYLGDIITPIKRELLSTLRIAETYLAELPDTAGLRDRLRNLRHAETRMYADICRAFRMEPLDEYETKLLQELDSKLCVTESQRLCAKPIEGDALVGDGFLWCEDTPDFSKDLFTDAFITLIHRRGDYELA